MLRRLGRRDAASFPASAFGLPEPKPAKEEHALEPPPQAPTAPHGLMMHRLLSTDTLTGVALRYDTTPSAILRLNKLPSEAALHARATLLVPLRAGLAPPPGQAESEALAERKLAMRKLREAARLLGERLSTEEATLYLDETASGADWEAAAAEFEADVAWERSEGTTRAQTLRRAAARAPMSPHNPSIMSPLPTVKEAADGLAELRLPLLG